MWTFLAVSPSFVTHTLWLAGDWHVPSSRSPPSAALLVLTQALVPTLSPLPQCCLQQEAVGVVSLDQAHLVLKHLQGGDWHGDVAGGPCLWSESLLLHSEPTPHSWLECRMAQVLGPCENAPGSTLAPL